MSDDFNLQRFAAEFQKANRKIGADRSVYCISEGSGFPVKIGITDNVDRRFSQLQANTWRKLVLCWAAPGWSMHEAAIKRIMSGRVLRNEWFHDADDTIKGMMRSHGELQAAIERFDRRKGGAMTRLTDTQRRILLTLSDGDWCDLSATFPVAAISRVMRNGWIRQAEGGRIIGALYTITPEGDAMLRAAA